MRKWKVEYKEVGSDKIHSTIHIGTLNKQGVIEFFGLEGFGVDWYRVTEIK